jgi:cytochrome b6-f complex iron-sulfur subunit
MERKDFIEQVGLSGASILIFGCMQACSKSETTSNTNNNNGNNSGNTGTNKAIDFTINITVSPYTSLNTPGGFYVESTTGIIIARTLNSEFIAVSSACTHQGAQVEFQSNRNRFFCSAHGSVFDATGAVTTGPATAALKQYKTSLSGSNLRVYS